MICIPSTSYGRTNIPNDQPFTIYNQPNIRHNNIIIHTYDLELKRNKLRAIDQAALLNMGARIFRCAFYCTILCSETRIFCNINLITTHHIMKNIDQQWPFLDHIYVLFSTFFDVTRSNITITYYGRWPPIR